MTTTALSTDQLICGIPTEVLWTDGDGCILTMTPSCALLLGSSVQALQAQPVEELLAEWDRELIRQVLTNTGNIPSKIFAHCVGRTRGVFPTELTVSRLGTDTERVLCWHIRVVETTTPSESSERGDHAKQLHVVASALAHGFNNLLTSVKGHLELVDQQLPAPTPVRGDIQTALRDVNRMEELLNRSITSSGIGILHRERLDINALVASCGADLAKSSNHRVTARINQAETPSVVHGDRELLERLVTQLVANADEAIGQQKGSIDIASETIDVDAAYLAAHSFSNELDAGRYHAIRVSDTGYGMDEVMQTGVFMPFFSTKGIGRGLGLPEVKGIALAHHGAMSYSSTLGEGSTFTLLLPICSGEPGKTKQPTGLPRRYVQVVDDESGVRRYATRVLENQGFGVFTSEDGPDAIDVFRAHADEISLVLLDMFMPGMNGNHVLRHIRKIRPDIPVLITSGYNESVFLRHFLEERPDGFLHKPFSTVQLMKMITDALNTKRESDEEA
jgi:nitrogen-specific signal transduction histidine kinase/CheY-like chemotaxis protein